MSGVTFKTTLSQGGTQRKHISIPLTLNTKEDLKQKWWTWRGSALPLTDENLKTELNTLMQKCLGVDELGWNLYQIRKCKYKIRVEKQADGKIALVFYNRKDEEKGRLSIPNNSFNQPVALTPDGERSIEIIEYSQLPNIVPNPENNTLKLRDVTYSLSNRRSSPTFVWYNENKLLLVREGIIWISSKGPIFVAQ